MLKASFVQARIPAPRTRFNLLCCGCHPAVEHSHFVRPDGIGPGLRGTVSNVARASNRLVAPQLLTITRERYAKM
jgi:hypothetical protein